ncbi:MAG: thioredoxin 1 [Pirellulaceae bacterium]|jgi:thioredoxin 1
MSIKNISQNEFDQVVLKSDKPVLVDFWSPTCGPCRAMNPVLDQLALDVEGQATVVKVNVDEDPQLAIRYKVSAIPNLTVFSGGELIAQLQGTQGVETLRTALLSA